MPWKTTTVLDERKHFIDEYERDRVSFSELCLDHGISRVTGYKWISRWEQEGEAGLDDRSRAPLHPCFEVSEDVEQRIVQARRKHPTWGPEKLLAWLKRNERLEGRWPAKSTVGEILSRHNLVRARKRRRRVALYEGKLTNSGRSNQLWCADFKGWFRARNGERCDPLTISDDFSRYLLRCDLVERTGFDHVWPVFHSAFREYGLPQAIRTDNGPPFASKGLFGLSRLTLAWMKLGIVHERIEPGKPQQNGRHERMHRTMLEVTQLAASSRRAQQRGLEHWRRQFNEERPHASLDNRVPAELYALSERTMPSRMPEFEYPLGLLVRKVGASGEIYWHHHKIFVSEIFTGELLGLKPITKILYALWMGSWLLGIVDTSQLHFEPDSQGLRAVEMTS